jgi:hypothetical protein
MDGQTQLAKGLFFTVLVYFQHQNPSQMLIRVRSFIMVLWPFYANIKVCAGILTIGEHIRKVTVCYSYHYFLCALETEL